MSELTPGQPGQPIPDLAEAGGTPQSVHAIVGGDLQPVELAKLLTDQEDKTVVPSNLHYLKFLLSHGDTMTVDADTLRQHPGTWAALMQYLSPVLDIRQAVPQKMLDDQGKEIPFRRLLEEGYFGVRFRISQVGEGEFVGETKGGQIENITGQELAGDLQGILGDENERALLAERLKKTFGFSQEQVDEAFEKMQLRGEASAEDTKHAVTIKPWWFGLPDDYPYRKLPEIKGRIVDIKGNIDELYKELRGLKDKGPFGKNLENEEKRIRDDIGELRWEEEMLGWIEWILEEEARREQEDEPEGDELNEFRELVKAFAEALPIAIPLGLAGALILYLLSRRKMTPARAPKRGR